MIIDDRNLFGSGISPSEDDAPLIVNSDRVKPFEISAQGLKAIAWRHPQILKGLRLIHLDQFPQRHPSDPRKSTVRLFLEKLFRIAIGKRLNHYGDKILRKLSSRVNCS